MKKRKTGKKTMKVRTLPPRNASKVKGGGALSDVTKSIGGAIVTAVKIN